MRCLMTMVAALSVAIVSGVSAQDEIFSGPQPGEELKPFKVLQVNSPDEVEEIEIGNDDNPTLICFMHRVSEAALGLLISVEFYASKQEGLNDHYIMLTEDRAKTEQDLKRWAQRKFMQRAPFALSPDGPEGPGDLGLNRNVTATILVAKGKKILNNFAFQDPNASDAPEILEAIASSLGKEAPDYDELRKEMQQQRQERNRMRMRENPIVKLAPNEDVGVIMLRMLRTEADRAENAKKRKGELLEWAADNAEKMSALKKYCKAILEGDFEMDEFSKKALQEIAKDE